MELAETKLVGLFYHELWWLSNGVVKKCEEIFEKAKVPEHGYMIQVDPELHSTIASILSDAANIKKLIRTSIAKQNGENGERFKLRKERARELSQTLGSLPLDELLNHKVRNTLEHFDEYLDEANYNISKNQPVGTIAAYNMVISHWEVTSPRVYPIRLYVSSERKFYNMKWKVDIGLMKIEAELIVKKLNELSMFANQEPGGLMIHI
jgi:hypothetical protein